MNLITGSGIYKMAQEAVKVMESFMPIYIRYSAAAFQPCIRFTLSPDKPRVGKEPLTVFNEAASPKYREMFPTAKLYIKESYSNTGHRSS